MEDVRILFDCLMSDFPSMASYISPDANIVHSPNFENGNIKIFRGKFADLTANVCMATDCLKKASIFQENDANSYADNILLASKARKDEIGSLKWISPTSNLVERLFSRTKMIETPFRNRLTPIHLEETCFLMFNRSLWNSQTVQSLLISDDN